MRALAFLLLLGQIAAASAGSAEVAVKIDELRQTHHVAAAAVVLVDRDALRLHRTYGVMDWDSARPVTADTRFRAGSISKAFTALALLRAQAQGLLQLDQPVRKLAPDAPYDNPWEATDPLRLAQLLEHTAGWYDMSTAEFDSSDPKPLSLTEALAIRPASRISHWPPGLHCEYSNSGPGLAAYVLEQRCGCAFEDYIRAAVFQPLGMSTASLVADKATLEHLAQGYDRNGKTPLPYWHVLYRPAAGLNLNPRDMALFLRMLLNRGRVNDQVFLTPEQVWRMEHPQTTLAARNGLDFGYGLGIRQYQHKGRSLFGHGGDADGYLAHFAYSPQSGRGYFVVITAFNSPAINQMQEVLDGWLIENLPRPSPPPLAALSRSALQELAGDYLAASTRFPAPGWERQRLRVLVRENRLYTRDEDGSEDALIAVDGRRFRRPWETIATSIFIPQSDHSMVLQGPMGNWRRLPRRR